MSDPLEHQVLEAARRELVPPSERLDVQFSTLLSRVQAGHLAPFDAPCPPDLSVAGSASGSMLKLGSWGLLAVGASLGLAVGFAGGLLAAPHFAEADAVSLSEPVAQPARSVGVPVHENVSTPKTIKSDLHELAAAPLPSISSEHSMSREGTVVKAQAPTQSSDSGVQDPKEPTDSALYREISYLRQAQSALRQGKPIMALGLMESLDEIVSPGALGAERLVTKVLALCALERPEEAQIVADSLLRALPGSPYAARISNTCARSSER